VKATFTRDIKLGELTLEAGKPLEVAHVFFKTGRDGRHSREPLLVDVLWFDGREHKHLTVGTDIPLSWIVLVPDTALEASLVKVV